MAGRCRFAGFMPSDTGIVVASQCPRTAKRSRKAAEGFIENVCCGRGQRELKEWQTAILNLTKCVQLLTFRKLVEAIAETNCEIRVR